MMRTIIFFILFVIPVSTYAASDAVQVQLNVEGCNNNSICEAVIGEDALSCPNDCTVAPSGGNISGSYPIPRSTDFFQNVLVTNGTNRVTVTWQSSVPTLSLVRWGLSQEFQEGSIASTEFVKDHRVDLTDLVPGSFYYFTIDSRDAYSHSFSLPYRMVFTPPLPDTIPPQNPSSFTALSSDNGVLLHWINPTDNDFASVRIMQNTDHFHASPFVGQLVYEGKGNTFLDKQVDGNTTYYYAIFAKDKNGNYSSGAATTGIYRISNEVPPPKEQVPPVIITIPQEQEIPFSKFTVSQGNGITLSIPASEVPQGITDLWVTVISPSGGATAQYLFSYDTETSTYKASIPGENSGTFQARIMAYEQGKILSISKGTVTAPKEVVDQSAIIFPDVAKLLSILIPLILLVLLILFRRYFFHGK